MAAMFKVEFFVDDKKLGLAMRALIGLAQGQPTLTPVVNIEKRGNGVAPVTNGGSLDRLAHYLKAEKITDFDAERAIEIVKAIGLQASSRDYFYKRAVKAGIVKQKGQGAKKTYQVM